MKKNNFIISLISLFIYNCESDLIVPNFEVYLCPTSNVETNLVNSSNIEISWLYPDVGDLGCDERADAFIINYLISDEVVDNPEILIIFVFLKL